MIKNFGEVVDFKEMSTMGEQDGLRDNNMKLHWQLRYGLHRPQLIGLCNLHAHRRLRLAVRDT